MDQTLPLNIIFVGVGGQGVLTASEILARAAMNSGLACKKSEVHGMAQRGGSVESQVRIGEVVYSPLIPAGRADFMVAFEKLEALRNAHRMKPDGVVILNLLDVRPLFASSVEHGYPADVEERLGSLGLKVVKVPGPQLAAGVGDARSAGSALLGALSGLLPFEASSWQAAFKETFRPRVAALNMRAFLAAIRTK